MESCSGKVADWRPVNLLENELHYRVLHVIFAEFLEQLFCQKPVSDCF